MSEYKETIVDGVKIIQDGDVTHFIPIDEPKKEEKQKETKEEGVLDKVCSWWDSLIVKPCIKIRDLANPFGDRDDYDVGSDGKTGIEFGIKFKF